MTKKITVISCLIFVAAIMMFAQPAISGKWADTPSGLDVQIIGASVMDFNVIATEEGDVGVIEMLIFGYNFDNGAEPIVKLADTPCVLQVGGADDPEQPIFIVEEREGLFGLSVECSPLPEIGGLMGLPFPNFLLTVQTGSSVHQFDAFNVLVPYTFF